jgi:hypothetical protein
MKEMGSNTLKGCTVGTPIRFELNILKVPAGTRFAGFFYIWKTFYASLVMVSL